MHQGAQDCAAGVAAYNGPWEETSAEGIAIRSSVREAGFGVPHVHQGAQDYAAGVAAYNGPWDETSAEDCASVLDV